MGLNTNLLYSQNKLTGKSADPAQQFQWMTATLSDARKNNEKVSAKYPVYMFIWGSKHDASYPKPQTKSKR